MIPDVEEIRGEAQLLPLRDMEILDQRKIPVLLEGPAINIPPQIPERRGAGIWIQCASSRIGGRREGKVCAIEISIVHTRYHASRSIACRDRPAGNKLRAGNGRLQSAANVGSTSRSIQHGKWRAGLKNGDTADCPSAQSYMSESRRVLEEWKFISVAGHETVGPIEIRKPARGRQRAFIVERGIQSGVTSGRSVRRF